MIEASQPDFWTFQEYVAQTTLEICLLGGWKNV